MANKRILKKRINKFGSELFAECIAAYLVVQEDDLAQLDDILTNIIKTHSEFIRRISYPEPGMIQKRYYQILWKEFKKNVDEVSDNIKALV